MKSRAAWGWSLALLTGIAGAAGWSSGAVGDGPSPVALNIPAPELVGQEWATRHETRR